MGLSEGLSEAGGTQSRWHGMLSWARRKVMAVQGGGLLFGLSEKAAKSHRKFLSVVRLLHTGWVLEPLLERRKGLLHRVLPEPLPAGGTCAPGPAARAGAS